MMLPDMPDARLRDIPEMRMLFKPIRSLGWKNITQVMRTVPLSVADLIIGPFQNCIIRCILQSIITHMCCIMFCLSKTFCNQWRQCIIDK